jgi:prolyl-tRNA synthetase
MWLVQVHSFEDFKAALAERKCILAPWAPDSAVEEQVKKATTIAGDPNSAESVVAGAKTLCCPFEQPPLPTGQTCIFAQALLGEARPATQYALWGRSY